MHSVFESFYPVYTYPSSFENAEVSRSFGYNNETVM